MFFSPWYVSPGTKLLSSWLELELNFNFVFFVVTYHEIWQYYTMTLQPPGIIVRVSIQDWAADLNRSQYFLFHIWGIYHNVLEKFQTLFFVQNPNQNPNKFENYFQLNYFYIFITWQSNKSFKTILLMEAFCEDGRHTNNGLRIY